MDNKNLPIKIFEKRKKVDERRTEAGGSDKLPSWAILSLESLNERVAGFQTVLDLTSKKIINKEKKQNFIPSILQLEINDLATAKSHRSDITNIFNVNYNFNVIGMKEENKLLVKVANQNDI